MPSPSRAEFLAFVAANPGKKIVVAADGSLTAVDNLLTAEEAAQQAEVAKDLEDAQAARTYAKLVALRNMSPAQVQAWVTANVTNLAQARDAIETLAVAVSVLARRL